MTACVLGFGAAQRIMSQERDVLPRRASLGVALGFDEASATTITSILDGSSAAAAQLRVGDVIEAMDGHRVRSLTDVQGAVGKHRSGESLQIDFRRDGKSRQAVAILKPLPVERMQNATLEYRHVTIEDGIRLRTILSIPSKANAATPAPGVLLLQGGSCGSIDIPLAPNFGQSALMHAIGSQGFATLRVEKPGIGDSEGPPCPTIGYRLELEGYRAALRALLSNPAVDPKRVFLLGISLGGFFAPIVARDANVAGITVYGTIAFVPSPYPGRGDLFFREIAGVDILAAWAGVDTPVQTLRGEYDDRTTRDDHETIVRIVNERHPGYAEHRELANLDHCATRHASLSASKNQCGTGAATSDLSDAVLAFLRTHS